MAAGVFASSFTGCTSLTQPINGVPATRLPPQFFPEPKADLVPVDVSILTVEPPRDYQLSGGDILGIYVEGVLPFIPPDQPPGPPPVNFPDSDSTLPPSIGFPIPVQDDGTLSLPLLEPLDVEGLTLDQVRDAIRDAYIEAEILLSEKARPIVTVIRERTYNVIVVREDTSGGGAYIKGDSDQSATGGLVKLPAYQNDILHALVETGGLPELNARNEVMVLRASNSDKRKRADFLRNLWQQQEAARLAPCVCPPKLPDDPAILRIPYGSSRVIRSFCNTSARKRSSTSGLQPSLHSVLRNYSTDVRNSSHTLNIVSHVSRHRIVAFSLAFCSNCVHNRAFRNVRLPA